MITLTTAFYIFFFYSCYKTYTDSKKAGKVFDTTETHFIYGATTFLGICLSLILIIILCLNYLP